MMFVTRKELTHYFTCFGYVTHDYAGILSFHVSKENTIGIYIASRRWYFVPFLRLNFYVQKEGLKSPFHLAWYQLMLFTITNRIDAHKSQIIITKK